MPKIKIRKDLFIQPTGRDLKKTTEINCVEQMLLKKLYVRRLKKRMVLDHKL